MRPLMVVRPLLTALATLGLVITATLSFTPASAQLLIASSVRQQHGTQLTFRGTLMASNGRPETSPQTVHFTVRSVAPPSFATQSRADEAFVRWHETLVVQPDAEGRYIAILGSGSPAGLPVELMRDNKVLAVTTERAGAAAATALIITTPQGIYQDCNLDGQECSGPAGDTAISQLDKIGKGGFTLLLNYSAFWGTAAQVTSYAAEANNVGVNIIWSFDDPDFAKYATKSGNYLITDYAELSATCKCTTNKGFIQYLVALTSKFPATYGYSIADEPKTSTSSQVKSLYTIVHAADPNHVALLNATYDDATQPTLADIQKNLDPFNFADVLGADFYPWGTGAPISNEVPASANTQTVANNYGKRLLYGIAGQQLEAGRSRRLLRNLHVSVAKPDADHARRCRGQYDAGFLSLVRLLGYDERQSMERFAGSRKPPAVSRATSNRMQ